MNNLEKARRALSGTKRYKVEMSRSEYSYVEVDAKDEDEARGLAYDLEADGKANQGDSGDLEILEIKEIT